MGHCVYDPPAVEGRSYPRTCSYALGGRQQPARDTDPCGSCSRLLVSPSLRWPLVRSRRSRTIGPFRDRLVTVVDDSVEGINDRLGTDFSTTQFDCLIST